MKRLLLAAALLVMGCAAPVGRGLGSAEVRTGIVEWRIGRDGAVLSLELASNGPDSLEMRLSEADREVLRLTLIDGRWVARGALAMGGWSGTWNTAPVELSGWVTLGEALASADQLPDGASEYRSGRMSVRFEKSSGSLRSMELACVATDDRFRVRF